MTSRNELISSSTSSFRNSNNAHNLSNFSNMIKNIANNIKDKEKESNEIMSPVYVDDKNKYFEFENNMKSSLNMDNNENNNFEIQDSGVDKEKNIFSDKEMDKYDSNIMEYNLNRKNSDLNLLYNGNNINTGNNGFGNMNVNNGSNNFGNYNSNPIQYNNISNTYFINNLNNLNTNFPKMDIIGNTENKIPQKNKIVLVPNINYNAHLNYNKPNNIQPNFNSNRINNFAENKKTFLPPKYTSLEKNISGTNNNILGKLLNDNLEKEKNEEYISNNDLINTNKENRHRIALEMKKKTSDKNIDFKPIENDSTFGNNLNSNTNNIKGFNNVDQGTIQITANRRKKASNI